MAITSRPRAPGAAAPSTTGSRAERLSALRNLLAAYPLTTQPYGWTAEGWQPFALPAR